MEFILAIAIVLGVLGSATGVTALILVLAMKNSTHKIQWVSPDQAVSDEELEREMMKPAVKRDEELFDEEDQRPRPLPSIFS